MRIYIKQRGSRYKFFKGKEEGEPFLIGYWDSKRKIGLHSKILNTEKEELVTIDISYSPWFWKMHKIIYRIVFHKLNAEVEVKAANYFRGHWTFVFGGDRYDYYAHYGRKKSLYKNDNQVAKYSMGTVNVWDRDFGFIISNNDENELLLLSVFLMLDMGEDMDGDLNIDLGNMVAGVKEYNE